MKKWIALLLALVLALSLAACGKAAEKSTVSEPPVEKSETVSEPVSEPEPEPEPEPAAPAFTNPLSGEAVESDISANRPLAIMLNTLKKALPQSGCGSADMLIEIPEEGGITRVMAVFQDPTGVGNLGTVRSTREYFVAMAMGLDAMLAHAGGSSTAKELLSEQGYTTLDYMSHGDLYWRDPDRKANLGTEHSLYTSSDNLQNYLAETTKIRTTHEDGFTSPYTFVEDGTPAGGTPATDINVSFSSYKDTRFVYDAASGKYQVYAFGDPYMDANTNEQVGVTNVLVVPTAQSTKADGQLQEFDLSSGTGYFFCGGAYTEINWQKGDLHSPMTFTNKDGTPLNLGVGHTYICICDTDREITIQ